MKQKLLLLLGLTLGLAIAVGLAITAGWLPGQPQEAEPPSALALGADSAVWTARAPKHVASYIRTEEVFTDKHPNAPEPYSYLDNNPGMKVIWDGFGFSKAYNKPRGHVYSVESLINTARPKPGAACFACKSTGAAIAYEEQGAGNWEAQNFDEAVAGGDFEHPNGCLDCHDPETNKIRLSRPYVAEALKRQGKDDAYIAEEMGNLVCAQCHVEYFFKPGGTLEITLPWDNGFTIDDIDRYYKEYQMPDGTVGFTDFQNPTLGTGIVKIQHPEYELFKSNGTSVHDRMGLTCVSCHMPKMIQDDTEITSHWWTSPLRHMEESCGQCHDDLEDTRRRVEAIQAEIETRELEVILPLLAETGELIKEQAENGATEAQLARAREYLADAILYWDWVSAENSYGFHNPSEARRVLDIAEDLANKAMAEVEAIQ